MPTTPRDNPAWVLLRGLTRDSRHWGRFAEQFGQGFPETGLLTVDLPGNGALHRELTPWTIEGIAAHCRAQLAARGHSPPYRLLALSLGAMTAVAWMTRHPAEVDAAVLINTSMRPYCPLHWRMRPAAWPELLGQMLGAPDAADAERAILRLTSRRADDPELLARWARWRAETPVSRASALRQLVAAARFRAPREPPAAPVLLLSSGGDQLVDPRCTLALARAWGCAHVQHPDAGHDLCLDDGPWVVSRVRHWIDTVCRNRESIFKVI